MFQALDVVEINTQSDWLNLVVAGGSRGVLSCNQSVVELSQEIKTARQEALSEMQKKVTFAAEAEINAAARKGRDALGLSDCQTVRAPRTNWR
jgi:transposase-like protein